MAKPAQSLRSACTLVLCVLIASLVAVPLLQILSSLGQPSGGTWQHLRETVLPRYLWNTMFLAIGVGFSTVVMGVGAAWLVTRYRFIGSWVFEWALLLPLAIPSYLLAYAATDVFQFSGPVQTSLRELFDWSRNDYWFPNARSLPGAIVILSVNLYPYVYLTSRAAFLEQSSCVREMSRTLGLGPWKSFFRVSLPMARPSIFIGVSLVVMETLSEFGAVDYCAVDTLATGIYRTWTSRGSLVAASQLSLCLLGAVGFLIAFESLSRRSLRFYSGDASPKGSKRIQLSFPKGLVAALFCGSPILAGFLLPVTLFAYKTWNHGDERAMEMLSELGKNSLILATVAASLAVLLGLYLSHVRRVRPSLPIRMASRVSGLGYAIPGGVIAMGVLGAILHFENGLNQVFESLFSWSPGFFFSGSIVVLIVAYQTRFLSVSLGVIQAGMTRIHPDLDSVSRTLGKSGFAILSKVHLPILKRTLLCAFMLVFVDVLKELPATLILRPFNFDTLAVRVYQLASDERLDEASTAAIAIIATGIIPVILLSRLMSRGQLIETPFRQTQGRRNYD